MDAWSTWLSRPWRTKGEGEGKIEQEGDTDQGAGEKTKQNGKLN